MIDLTVRPAEGCAALDTQHPDNAANIHGNVLIGEPVCPGVPWRN